MIVYVDILIVVNLIINYLLLLSVKRMVSAKTTEKRLIAASSIGAVYSLVIFLPEMGAVISGAFKLVVSGLMIAVAFQKTRVKVYLKRLTLFYIISSVFAGIMMLFYFLSGSAVMEYGNGITYLRISAPVLVLSAGGIYILLSLVRRFFMSTASEKEVCRVRITKGEKSVVLFALMDNGNRLYDNLTSLPVAVGRYKSLKPLLKEEEESFFKGDIGMLIPPYKLVPYNSVGGKGLLPAFTPEKVEVEKEGKWVAATPITVASGDIMPGEYDMILPKNFKEDD